MREGKVRRKESEKKKKVKQTLKEGKIKICILKESKKKKKVKKTLKESNRKIYILKESK